MEIEDSANSTQCTGVNNVGSEQMSRTTGSASLVNIHFTIDGVSSVDSSINISSAPLYDINKVVDSSITSFTYTGRHDHGDLPILNGDGYLSQLTSALYEAKAACDTFLTAQIAKNGEPTRNGDNENNDNEEGANDDGNGESGGDGENEVGEAPPKPKKLKA